MRLAPGLATSWAWIGIGLVSLGCGDAGGEAGVGGGEADGGVKTYSATQLPLVKQELPPLDGGRVEVPTPEGWQAGSRTTGVLARFHVATRTGMPQIILKVEEAPAGTPDVTAQTVFAYATQVQAELDEQVQQQKTTLIEDVRALVLGTNAWVRYVVPGRLPGRDRATIERQILKTVVRGRVYSIDLQTHVNELLKHRDHAYAIAANMKWSAGDGTNSEPDKGEEKADPGEGDEKAESAKSGGV